jgi:hypothetical protein
MIANTRISFPVKYVWNGILSVFLFSPRGLFYPVWCRNSAWISAIPAITNGVGKCSAKNPVNVALSTANRVNVTLPTANPPHTHWTIFFPTYGIADSRFVITVAPQKDICPYGSTYPINAVAIVKNRIGISTDHVCITLYDS